MTLRWWNVHHILITVENNRQNSYCANVTEVCSHYHCYFLLCAYAHEQMSYCTITNICSNVLVWKCSNDRFIHRIKCCENFGEFVLCKLFFEANSVLFHSIGLFEFVGWITVQEIGPNWICCTNIQKIRINDWMCWGVGFSVSRL